MINTSELRRGNIVGVKRNGKGATFFTKVESILNGDIFGVAPGKETDWGNIWDGIAYTKELEGIPLTLEWLEKAGFTRRDNFAYDFGKLSIVLKGDHGYKEGRTYYNSWAILESQPKYVHSLQNIIYALEGKELIISRK